MRLPTLSLFICFQTFFSILSAQEASEKTSIYEKHGKPSVLVPKWKVTGKIDTFRLTLTKLDVENGDTLKNKKESYIFMHRVDAINAQYIDQTFWLSREKYNDRFTTKDCNVVDLGKPFLEIRYRTPKTGKSEDCQLLNCEDFHPTLVEHYTLIANCTETNNNDYLTKKINKKNIALASNCDGVAKIFSTELLWLHIPYGQLIPKKGRLRYKTTYSKEGFSLSQYTYCTLKKNSNGHRQYEVGEDSSKGDPLFVQTMKAVDVASNPLKILEKDSSEPIIEEKDKTILEVDEQNCPVCTIRTRYSRFSRKGNDKVSFIEQKVERIGQ